MEKTGESRHHCLADFVAPHTAAHVDYCGLFAVTMGQEVEDFAETFEKGHSDDYMGIMVKALGDRLAEAYAEYLHAIVRKDVWGYAPHEDLGMKDLIMEKYRGIRPAPGYPACPDHTEKQKIWSLLEVEKRAGIRLTENFAMTPPSSVSGYYFAHPEAQYFRVGMVDEDQLEDYAKRKGWSLEVAKKWLAPNDGSQDS